MTETVDQYTQKSLPKRFSVDSNTKFNQNPFSGSNIETDRYKHDFLITL